MRIRRFNESFLSHEITIRKFLNENIERTTYNGYKIGDIIDGSQLDALSGGEVGNDNNQYKLVQKSLSDFSFTRQDLDQEYVDEEIWRLESMKKNFDKTPPIPQEGDGMHRIIAAKELGYKTILMWEPIESSEPIKTWGGDNLGDIAVVKNGNTSELPETQNEDIPDGEYVLSIIPINKTTLYKKGLLTRDAFKEDDYDGWQTEHLNDIKKSFDSSYRTPIIVLEDKDGNYFVIDGHHRLTIANEIGRETILAYVKKYGIENDKHIFF